MCGSCMDVIHANLFSAVAWNKMMKNTLNTNDACCIAPSTNLTLYHLVT
jgi:hypothetical protein